MDDIRINNAIDTILRNIMKGFYGDEGMIETEYCDFCELKCDKINPNPKCPAFYSADNCISNINKRSKELAQGMKNFFLGKSTL